MEHGPSEDFAEATAPSGGKFASRPFFRGAVSALLLVAGAAGLSHMNECHPAASAGEKAMSELEKLLVRIPKMDVPELLRLLDHDAFRIRETAQKTLFSRAIAHIEKHGMPPAWLDALTPVFNKQKQWMEFRSGQNILMDDPSLEAQRRAVRLRQEIGYAHRQRVFAGAQFEFPDGELEVGEVLRKLSEATGAVVDYYGASHQFSKERVRMGKNSDFWNVFRNIPLSGNKRLCPYVSMPWCVDLAVGDEHDSLTANNGSLFLNIGKDGYYRLFTEPGKHLHHHTVKEVRVVTQNGVEYGDMQFSEENRIPLPLFFRRYNVGRLEVDIECRLSRTETHSITDVAHPSEIRASGRVFRYLGTTGNMDMRGHSIVQLEFPPDAHELHERISCMGFDAQGGHERPAYWDRTPRGKEWSFKRLPTRLRIYIPDHRTEATDTRTFGIQK